MLKINRKKRDDGFYHIDDLIAEYPGCQYYMIFGERSNGKTYTVLEKIVQNYWDTGKQGAIIRRTEQNVKGITARTYFNGLIENGRISEITNGEWDGIYYYSMSWFLCKEDPDRPGHIKHDTKPLCYFFALNTWENTKGGQYPDVTTILFDEFMTRDRYLTNEWQYFTNVLSTIIRKRTDVTIFMVGNTVNRTCPYFNEMGLTGARDLKQGEKHLWEYHATVEGRPMTGHIAVEHTGTSRKTKGKPSDIYFCFDNPSLNMITQGDWEIKPYPTKPVNFEKKNIKFTFFIIFDGETLQCEIVMFKHYNFMFVHPKTTPLYHPEDDLIFTQEANPLFNYSRKINQGQGKVKMINKILSYFNNEKVFYANNSTGEIMRNYMQWCKSDGILS